MKEKKYMLQPARLFWALAALVLVLQVAAFGSNGRFQEPAADNSDKAKTQLTSKSSKKRKKKKAVTTVPYVVFSPSPQTPVTSASPITVNSVEELPTPPPPAARNVSGAEKTPGVHVAPTGIPTETPLGPAPTATAGQLVISEFRLRGPNVANPATDEFIEIYNTTGADHTVVAASGTGYGVAASDGTTRCSIPNGTVIPARGHFLCVNTVGFSLGAYPAGSGTIGTGDATYTTDIPDNAGIALFNNNTGGGSYSLANRLDAVGSTSEANTTYKEGTGYPAITAFDINYSFYRDTCGKGGSITTLGACPSGGLPVDTNNNSTDFIFVDTNGTSAGAGQRLGSPGPENLSSPIQRNAVFAVNFLNATVAASSPPNRVRDFTSDPANNSTFGTLSIRRRIVNNTGGNVTRLRFRVVDQTTFPAPSGFADLRTRTSAAVVVAGITDAATCAATGAPTTPPCTVTVQGTTLEQPPPQPNGGAFNGSYSAGTVTLGTPLANGASINLQFLLGLQQTGTFKFYINVEALP
jgi:hypothetical protein